MVCLCGCGLQTKVGNKYLNGHNGKQRKGTHWSLESREKLSRSCRGRQAWNKGLTTESDPRVAGYALSQKGRKFSLGHRQKLSDAHKGYRPTKETIEKIRKKSIGRKLPEMSERRKGVGNPFFGKVHSEESKDRIRMANIGRNNRVSHTTEWRRKLSKSNTGKVFSLEHRMNLSIAARNKPSISEQTRKRMSVSQKRRWTPVSRMNRAEQYRAMWKIQEFAQKMKLVQGAHPNNIERTLGKIISSSLPGEYRYTGDGSFSIMGLIPDFTNCNGQKKVIELFGDYWHRGQNPQTRIDKFAEFGFQCLVIWEHELRKKSSEEITMTVSRFNESKANPQFGERGIVG